ncbi:MAG: SDR family NAD(P)-dependent oxidoreductase [Deltaproteobacteria bacterium]
MSEDRLRAKCWIVTGGASGIGLATARLMASRGARVLLWDIDAAGLEAAGRELSAPTAVVDVTDASAVREAMASAVKALGGRLDGVLHAAGILHTGVFEAMSDERLRKLVDVNLCGSLYVAQAAIAPLRATRGSLVFMASASGFAGPPEFAAYAASKAAVISLAETLRVELGRDGIHVAAVCPLFVDTPMLSPESGNRSAKLFRSVGMVHTAEAVAQSIVRAVESRRFLVTPGIAAGHYLATRHLPGVAALVTRLMWR